MTQLIVAAGVLALGVALMRAEPRRLGNGVVLLTGISMVGFGVVELVGQLGGDPGHLAGGLALLALLSILFGYAAVLALAGVYYGVEVLRRERVSPATALALVAGLGLLTYLALGVAAVRGGGSEPMAVAVLLSALPIGYLGFAFTAFLGYSWLYGRQSRLGPTPAGVIVLGAGLAGDQVTPLLAGRLRTGREVYDRARAAGTAAVLVTSGGQGPDELMPEARAMADWLIADGVPADHVLVEDRSRTTRENLLESRQMLAKAGVDGPVTVVTSSYHALRAATLMRTVGLAGNAVGAPTARYFWPSAMVREFVALLRDNLRLNAVLLGLLSLPLVGYGAVVLVRALAG
ncbi:YdcF family protein [Georgenia sunbinii]|uniref:YdcF family protein n=1 Tax=Georgenia sunbinii TaxID=3117728 RepID=UPI002F2646D7